MFEALAHGCPVIVSDQVYSAEHLEPLGRILSLKEEQWAEFFQTRLCDEDYRRQVIASDNKAVDGYQMDKVAETWAGVLRNIFKQGDSYCEPVSQSA
jgi:spore coat polysaccharide biosynthesis predicted glycosyltransferase SpsG